MAVALTVKEPGGAALRVAIVHDGFPASGSRRAAVERLDMFEAR